MKIVCLFSLMLSANVLGSNYDTSMDIKKEREITVDAIFTDKSCSALKPNVTIEEIKKIDDEVLEGIAVLLLNEQYAEATYRIQQYEPYMPLDQLKAYLGNATPYSKFENPTGIRKKLNEDIYIFADGIGSYNVRVLVANLGTNDGSKAYKIKDDHYFVIKDGENVISGDIEGNLYIEYYTTDFETANKPTIHIATGSVCGYFNPKTHDNNYWVELLNMPFEILDICGETINMAFSRELLKEYCPNNGAELVAKYDKVVREQHDLMGLTKYNRTPKNKMFVAWNPHAKGPYASNQGVYIPNRAMHKWLTAWETPVEDCWGLYHELGHINAINGFKWNGMQEVVNNLNSCWNEYNNEAPTSLRYEYTQKDDAGDGLGKVIMGPYQVYLNQVVHADGVDWNSFADFTDKMGRDKTRAKVSFIWQLQLYFKEVLGKDAYEDYFEILRNSTIPSSTADQQINFYKYFCDATEMDLTQLFEKVKMLATYSSMMGKEEVIITQEMVDEAKAYVAAKNYPKPTSSAIYYITARTLPIYKNQTPIANANIGDGVVINGNVVNISNAVWEGAVAFESYAGEVITNCSIAYTNSLQEGTSTLLAFPANATIIKAVAWDGTKKVIYQK